MSLGYGEGQSDMEQNSYLHQGVDGAEVFCSAAHLTLLLVSSMQPLSGWGAEINSYEINVHISYKVKGLHDICYTAKKTVLRLDEKSN